MGYTFEQDLRILPFYLFGQLADLGCRQVKFYFCEEFPPDYADVFGRFEAVTIHYLGERTDDSTSLVPIIKKMMTDADMPLRYFSLPPCDFYGIIRVGLAKWKFDVRKYKLILDEKNLEQLPYRHVEGISKNDIDEFMLKWSGLYLPEKMPVDISGDFEYVSENIDNFAMVRDYLMALVDRCYSMISVYYLLLAISLDIHLPVLGNPIPADPTIKLTDDWPPPSGNPMSTFPKASVAADIPECNKAGTDVLKEGGNAVDSLIATLMCIGVFKPHSSGLGGGHMMTIYNASLGKCQAIVARETAPAAASTEMFVGRPGASFQGKESIATPGELHGLWTAYQKFGSGKVPWSRLLLPAIHYARNGFKVYYHYWHSINDPIVFDGLAKVSNDSRHLVYQPGTTKLLEEGTILKLEKYADTLEALANAQDPVELFYRGKIAQDIVKELGEKSHIRQEDLANYKAKIVEYPPTASILDGLEICGPPPPSSFVITQSIVQTMSEFYKNEKPDFNDPLYYHRLIEAMKFAYARRSELGDVDFAPHTRELLANMTRKEYSKEIVSLIKDTAQPVEYYRGMDQKTNHGTTHISILDQDGNAVSTTSSLNYSFGSMHIGNITGIIYNDAMDDFSTPGTVNYFKYEPSPTNFIKPGKRPMSSFSPMIVYNKKTKKVKMVIGSAGGSHIISGVSQVAARTLIFGQSVKEANDAPRLHSQFLPHVTETQDGFPRKIHDALITRHKQILVPYADLFASVNILKVRDDGSIEGNCDYRREPGNHPDGF